MSIRELHVSGYRSIRELRLCLNKVNVLTGPNGCGKSNLYNAVFLLAKTATGGFARVIAEEGGMPSVLWAGQRRSRSFGSSRPEALRMTLGVKTDSFSYEMSCGLVKSTKDSPSAFRLDPEIKEERVWAEGRKSGRVTFFERGASGTWVRDGVGKRVSYSGELVMSEGVFSQLREPHLYPELSAMRIEMGQWRFYHHFRTDTSSCLRRPQVGVQTPVLGDDGSDLAAALQTILEIGDAEQLRDSVANAFHGAALMIESSKASFSVLLQMPGLRRPLDSAELSDGTLRYLCLLAALLSPRPPALLALNEPETSLHPDLLDGLARLITRASEDSQLWITTHSPRMAELIECYSKEPNIKLQLVDGETRILGQKLTSSAVLEPSEGSSALVTVERPKNRRRAASSTPGVG
jgi:predicted ATPase